MLRERKGKKGKNSKVKSAYRNPQVKLRYPFSRGELRFTDTLWYNLLNISVEKNYISQV